MGDTPGPCFLVPCSNPQDSGFPRQVSQETFLLFFQYHVMCGLSRALSLLLAVFCLLSAHPVQITSLATLHSPLWCFVCLPGLLDTHSRDGPQIHRVEMEFTGRLLSSCGFFREGRMMGSQERSLQIQELESGFSACCHPAPCHSPRLQFDRTGALILLERETVTVGAWSPFFPGTCDESGGHTTHKCSSSSLLPCVPWIRQFK